MRMTLLSSGRKTRQELRPASLEARTAIRTIGRLTDYALDPTSTSDVREIVVHALDRYADRHRGTKKGMVAEKAAATIVAARMLEIFCDEGMCEGGAQL